MNFNTFGMATVCPPGFKPNKKYRAKRGQRQCKKIRPNKISLKELQAIAAANEISIYKRRKDDMGFTRKPLSVKALKFRLTKMKVPYGDGSNLRSSPIAIDMPVATGIPVVEGVEQPSLIDFNFGMATVCPPGYSPNPKWKKGPGQRQCLKDKVKKAKYTAAQIAAEPNPFVKKAMMKGLKVRPKKMTLKDLQRLAKANDVSIYKRRKDDMGFTRTPLTMKALKYRLTKMHVPYK